MSTLLHIFPLLHTQSGIVTYDGSVRGPMKPALASLVVSRQRLTTDPLFSADLTLDNIVVGSRYRVTRRSNGAELATGVAAGTSEVISGISVYENPMTVDITVRNASGATKYKIFNTAASIGRSGASAYILQAED